MTAYNAIATRDDDRPPLVLAILDRETTRAFIAGMAHIIETEPLGIAGPNRILVIAPENDVGQLFLPRPENLNPASARICYGIEISTIVPDMHCFSVSAKGHWPTDLEIWFNVPDCQEAIHALRAQVIAQNPHCVITNRGTPSSRPDFLN